MSVKKHKKSSSTSSAPLQPLSSTSGCGPYVSTLNMTYPQKLIFLYELTFGLYMLEPWEKTVFNSFAVVFMSFLLYYSYYTIAYLPMGLERLISLGSE